MTRYIPPTHPGEVLKEDIMDEMGLSARQVATILDVPANRITEIVRGRRSITADTALRLSQWLGTSPEFWLRYQQHYDLELARMEHGEEIKRRVQPATTAAD